MIGMKNATRPAVAWYVSYRTGGTTVMHILKDRELAIDATCRFFDRGYHKSLEVRPMLGSHEGNVLDEGDIQRIQEARTSHQQRWRSQIVVTHFGDHWWAD